jgi:hypothetical protein
MFFLFVVDGNQEEKDFGLLSASFKKCGNKDNWTTNIGFE